MTMTNTEISAARALMERLQIMCASASAANYHTIRDARNRISRALDREVAAAREKAKAPAAGE